MNIFKVANEFTILRGNKTVEPKFRTVLSKLIVEKYGRSYYDQDTVTDILYFCRNYYIAEFEKICNEQLSYSFYKTILWLHEEATHLRSTEHFENLPDGIDKSYIGEYRRILKMILEQGCYVRMLSIKQDDFAERTNSILNDLLFLGSMIICCAESIAEQRMIEDCIDIYFDENDLYKFGRRHHYEIVFEYLADKHEEDSPEYIIDENGNIDFKKSIKENFNLDYDKFWETIFLLTIHFKLEPGQPISFKKDGFLIDIQNHIECSSQDLENFLSGLILDKHNKMSLTELIEKPSSLERYLSRPFLSWNINNKEYLVFGLYSLDETQNHLYLNAIPWGKAPTEWMNVGDFKKYMNKKEKDHDKWLDDKVEENIKATGLLYERSVKKLITKQKVYPLEIKNLGEIDFIIISPNTKKVFVADCKHLLGRYDMTNQKNDYYNFTDDSKHPSYNTRMSFKINWLTENKNILQEHFQLKNSDFSISLDTYKIEGIFFINSSTFYMYNSDLRIYTYNQVADVITGKHVDPTFSYYVDEGDKEIFYSVRYPYFRKPKIIYYEDEDDDCEVDKYGYPIKK